MVKKRKRHTIGRTDKLDLPELGLKNISCKIDTGAETSAIHCHKVKLVEKDDKKSIKFFLLDPNHPNYEEKEYVCSSFSEKLITNSFGQSEFRYVINTKIALFGETVNIQFTLSDRQKMKFPILLGRKFLQKNKLLVDVSKFNVSYLGDF